MIVVEGPDGSGKTTLLERLSKEFEIEVAPRACTREGPIDNLAQWVEDDLSDHLRDFPTRSLHDRYPLISEMVYGPACRGVLAHRFDDPSWYSRWIDRFSRIGSVVWCLPRPSIVAGNVESSEHMVGVKENVDHIYGGYLALRAMWPSLVNQSSSDCQVTWDYEVDDFDLLVARIVRMETTK